MSKREGEEAPANWRLWLIVLTLFAWVPLWKIEEVDELESAKFIRVFRTWARRALRLQALAMLRIYAGAILARAPTFGDSNLQTVLHFAFPEPSWSALITWFTTVGAAWSFFKIYVECAHIAYDQRSRKTVR